uniref:Uncharacterized protein n=1 Tax=Anguilla anguilla TaxID=7936 RepID=A0A0E9RQT1_ANGAN
MCVLTTRSNPLSLVNALRVWKAAFLRMVRKNRVPAYKPTPADCNSICVWVVNPETAGFLPGTGRDPGV